jgi:phosphatidylserine/phosphatidylglycerophosphate/cardiolipin synthase-like enzyme
MTAVASSLEPYPLRLAELANAIADTGHLESVCSALEKGTLKRDSAGPVRAGIAAGSPPAEASVRRLQHVWKTLPVDITAPALAFALRVAAAAGSSVRNDQPRTTVVWTGPKVAGSFFRSTREVIRELLLTAQSEILVIGYWIAASEDGEGSVAELVRLLAEAVRQGRRVTIVMDERTRPDGINNRSVIEASWPAGIALPQLFTWRLPAAEPHLKLHAKVLVVDRQAALVTSANLTAHAMARNIEMGIRITGAPARDIASQFDSLLREGIIEPFPEPVSRG